MIAEIMQYAYRIVENLGVLGVFLGTVLIIAMVIIVLFGMQTVRQITEIFIK